MIDYSHSLKTGIKLWSARDAFTWSQPKNWFQLLKPKLEAEDPGAIKMELLIINKQ